MTLTLYEIGLISFFLFMYVMLGIVTFVIVDNSLYEYIISGGGKIVNTYNFKQIEDKKTTIAIFFGIMWPIALTFFLSKYAGQFIYDNFIFNGDEEDRIASWLF